MSEAQHLAPLYHWQLDALTSWLRCGRRGVIEAVTGSGKTDVALAAIADARRRGRFVLVVVPSRVLMEQWHLRLSNAFPDARLGRL
ncbi:MAG: DEAD/DEAH box helicase family protein, partial [Acidimicrobiia bacterium]|nr:DEAD/DEAH box helicase family protein [Acidimicrobiia bacterium]